MGLENWRRALNWRNGHRSIFNYDFLYMYSYFERLGNVIFHQVRYCKQKLSLQASIPVLDTHHSDTAPRREDRERDFLIYFWIAVLTRTFRALDANVAEVAFLQSRSRWNLFFCRSLCSFFSPDHALCRLSARVLSIGQRIWFRRKRSTELSFFDRREYLTVW